MTEEKKKPRPKVRTGAADSSNTAVDRNSLNIADSVSRSKPKPKPRTVVRVADLRLRYCTSTEDGPTSPLLDAHNAKHAEFMELWQPGKKWDKSQDGAYTSKGERKLPAVKVSAKNNNGYLVAYTKESMRKDSAMQSQQVFLLDYDRLPVGTLAATQKALNTLGIWHVTYTTASHLSDKKDGLECFRIGFVTDKPVLNTYDMVLIRVAFDDMLARLVPALEVDTASFAVSQPMFLPPHGSTVTVAGDLAISVTKLRNHFALHKLSVHRNSAPKTDAVVPDYIADLFQPLAQMLVDMGATTGRDGRMYLQATDEHAEQYSTETKPDDFSFMFPCDGVADQFNVGFIHGTDLDYRDSIRQKAGESAGKYAERRRMECIRYACTAVTEDGKDRQRLLLLMEDTLKGARDAWSAGQKEQLISDLGDDEDDAPAGGKSLALVAAKQAKARVRDTADLDDAKIDARISIKDHIASGGDASGLGWCYALIDEPVLFGFDVAYDRFLQTEVWRPIGTQGWRPVMDVDRTSLQMAAEQLARRVAIPESDMATTLRKDDFNRALDLYAQDHAFDSFIEWGQAIEWDGVEREQTWLQRSFGIPDSDYVRAAGRYMMQAMAGRMLSPGCQVDMVPLMVGEEGTGKSSTIKALAPVPEYFVEVSPDMEPRELTRLMMGKTIVELSELETLRSMKDKGKLKMFITTRTDHNRRMNANSFNQLPRRCTLWATSNPADVLGNDGRQRRWLPLEAMGCDAEYTREVCHQLWAEAIAKYSPEALRDAAYQVDKLANGVRDHYREENPLAEVVAEVMDELFAEDGLTMTPSGTNIMTAVMERVRAGAVGHAVLNNRTLAATLRQLGYNKNNRKKHWLKSQ